MSPHSQTSQPRIPLRIVLAALAVPLIAAVAVAPVRDYLLAAAARGRPHLPDMDVFAALSPVVKVHLLAALLALGLGAALMAGCKGQGFHRAAGWTWVALVLTTAGSSLFITSLNHGSWSLLHLLSGWTLLILPLAVLAARRRDVAKHRRRMMGLFYGGFAFNLVIAFIPGRTMWTMFFG